MTDCCGSGRGTETILVRVNATLWERTKAELDHWVELSEKMAQGETEDSDYEARGDVCDAVERLILGAEIVDG